MSQTRKIIHGQYCRRYSCSIRFTTGAWRSSSASRATASTASWRRCASAQDKIRFIQVRHEEAAAFMACAYAKYTGKLGVCLATSGPGGIHLLNGLYDAKLDGQPVLAITGHHFHDLIDTHAQQDVELDQLFMDVAVYNTRIMGAGHVENVADLACRTALAYRGVAHINFPVDLQEQEVGERALEAQRSAPYLRRLRARRARLPADDDLRARGRSPERRQESRDPCRPRRARRDRRTGERRGTLGAPIIKALLGKAAVPDDSPYTTGGIGLLGTKPSQEAMEDCDTLLMVGTSFPYIEFLPEAGPGARRSDRSRSDAHRPALSRSKSAWSATAAATLRRAAAAARAQRGPQFPRKGAGRAWRSGGS